MSDKPSPGELRVRTLEAKVAELEKVVAAMRAVFTGGAESGGAVAPDRDLDSKYGDEEISFNPKDWDGYPRKGWLMSRCEPEFLDIYAESKDYFASKDEASGKKSAKGALVAPYERKSAARARGWAKRLRAGWKPPGSTPPPVGEQKRSASIDDPYAPRDEPNPFDSADDGFDDSPPDSDTPF